MKTSGDGKIIVDAATEITTETGTEIASNDIYNVGTLNLNGDITINSAISDAETASGTTNLNGGTLTLGENATITQKDFNIASGVAFSTNADKLSIANLITNKGTLTFTGGTNNNDIAGEGALNITGTVTNADDATVEQNNLSIASGAGLTTNAGNLTITSAIQNAGTLTFNDGENANAVNNTGSLVFNGATSNSGEITGAGNTSIQSGTVSNTGSITQNNLSIASGAGLTTNAGNLTITSAIQNAGTLMFTGGANANAVQGAGTTVIAGKVTNNALISQSISVNDGAELTSDVSNIGGTIANEGQINLSGNNGTINNNITGTGNAEFSGSITNNALILQAVVLFLLPQIN